MTRKPEPDDPNRPPSSRPPRLPNNPEHGEIKRMVEHFDRTVGPFLKQGQEIPNSLREFMAYAFLAETSLKAKEACLVSEMRNGAQRWWFENRYPTEPAWKKHMMALEAENKFLKTKLKDFLEDTEG